MSDRRTIEHDLHRIEKDLRELEMHYEKYFSGVEKLEPIRLRETLSSRLRHFANRKIMQTDLRFKYQNLATRFHSYAGHWDRILRLMDEGRFIRGSSGLPVRTPLSKTDASSPPPPEARQDDEVDRLMQQLRDAGSPGSQDTGRDREKVARFLEMQRKKIKETFGEKDVEFRVVIEGGKPKIKVREKK